MAFSPLFSVFFPSFFRFYSSDFVSTRVITLLHTCTHSRIERECIDMCLHICNVNTSLLPSLPLSRSLSFFLALSDAFRCTGSPALPIRWMAPESLEDGTYVAPLSLSHSLQTSFHVILHCTCIVSHLMSWLASPSKEWFSSSSNKISKLASECCAFSHAQVTQ